MNPYWAIVICVLCVTTLLALVLGAYGHELIELVKLIYGPKPNPVLISEEHLNNAKAHDELWNECFNLRNSISALANNRTKSRVKK